jgi:hypothetical protein
MVCIEEKGYVVFRMDFRRRTCLRLGHNQRDVAGYQRASGGLKNFMEDGRARFEFLRKTGGAAEKRPGWLPSKANSKKAIKRKE